MKQPHFKTGLQAFNLPHCLPKIFSIGLLLSICALVTTARGQQAIKEDTVLVNKLIKDFNDSFDINPERALAAAQKVVDISEKSNYPEGAATGLLGLGKLYNKIGKPDKAIEQLQRALAISRKDHNGKLESKALNELGSIYDNRRDYNDAYSYFFDALKVSTEAKDTFDRAESYRFIGHSFAEQDNFAEAIKNLNKALEIYRSLNEPLDYAHLCTDLSAAYFNHNDFPTGLKYIHEAIGIYLRLQDTNALSRPYTQLATYFQFTRKYDSAKYYFNLSLKLAAAGSNKMKEAEALFSLAGLCDDMEDNGPAEKYFKDALNLSREISYERLMYDVPYNMARMYERMGDYKSAFYYLDTAYYVRSTLFDTDKARTVAEMNARYNTNELENKNKLLEKENENEHVRVQRKNILVYSGFGAAILCILIGFLLVRQNKMRADRQQLELEQKQLLAQINPHFIYNCLNSIQQFIVQNDTMNANKYLADFALLMRQTLENSKDGVITVRRELDYLENYLSFEVMRFEDKFTYTLACAEDVDADKEEIPSMIIQPFVENAIRHGLYNLKGKVGKLAISFYKKDGYLICEVDDNGIGMEEAQKIKEQRVIKYESHGMDLTKRRLALVSKVKSGDYKILVINKKDMAQNPVGTTIIIKFPLEA